MNIGTEAKRNKSHLAVLQVGSSVYVARHENERIHVLTLPSEQQLPTNQNPGFNFAVILNMFSIDDIPIPGTVCVEQ